MHKSDDDFLCKTNDRIDNAVYAVICAVAAGEDAKDTIQAAIDTIACDKYVVTDEFCQNIIKETGMALAEVGWLVENKLEDKRMGYEVGVPDWSIQVIGDLTEWIEYELDNANIDTCYPWQDDNEYICYSLEACCKHCKKKCC